MLTLTKRRQPLVRNIIKFRPKMAASHDQYRTQSEKIMEEARKQYSATQEKLVPNAELYGTPRFYC